MRCFFSKSSNLCLVSISNPTKTFYREARKAALEAFSKMVGDFNIYALSPFCLSGGWCMSVWSTHIYDRLSSSKILVIDEPMHFPITNQRRLNNRLHLPITFDSLMLNFKEGESSTFGWDSNSLTTSIWPL
jgi:hypothetical protein